jgi:hypothetical protein
MSARYSDELLGVRVDAHAMLRTDVYPPFRLAMGGKRTGDRTQLHAHLRAISIPHRVDKVEPDVAIASELAFGTPHSVASALLSLFDVLDLDYCLLLRRACNWTRERGLVTFPVGG